jgi:hypothetical protein
MRKLLLLLTISLFSLASISANTTEIMDNLKFLESNNDPAKIGDNGASFGILQIKQIAIDDVNREYGTQYTHQDAFNISCSEEIFMLYTQMWANKLELTTGRKATEYDIIRIWNGGPRGYQKLSTIPYLNKYKILFKKITENKIR